MSTKTSPSNIHDKDFYKWIRIQADFLKNGDYSKLDKDHLVEEMESLGNSERSRLKSFIENWLMHMLKAKYQPYMHSRSWDLSIKEASIQANQTFKKNPSLQPELKEIFADAYEVATLRAYKETGLPDATFPEECEWNPNHLFQTLKKKYQ